jgi:hypothetical protein
MALATNQGGNEGKNRNIERKALASQRTSTNLVSTTPAPSPLNNISEKKYNRTDTQTDEEEKNQRTETSRERDGG